MNDKKECSIRRVNNENRQEVNKPIKHELEF